MKVSIGTSLFSPLKSETVRFLPRKNLGVLQNSCEFGISLGATNGERWQNDVGKTVSSINWSQNRFFFPHCEKKQEYDYKKNTIII